jgi:ubiquinone/menaquinone biosynthesis C-methylase UbiE
MEGKAYPLGPLKMAFKREGEGEGSYGMFESIEPPACRTEAQAELERGTPTAPRPRARGLTAHRCCGLWFGTVGARARLVDRPQTGYESASMSRLFAAIYDPFMRSAERACLAAWRAALLEGATGDVLEIGAGTGANLPYYPPAVTQLRLTEPDRDMLARLRRRVEVAPVRQVDAQSAAVDALPFDDASFDTVVSTLVLCSVPDVTTALAEIRRVLRPGGRLLFLEHVAADDRPTRLAWQRRLEPLWMRVSGNCHLTRRTGESIRAAGFVVESETRESVRKALPIMRPSIRGVARRGA